MTQIKPRIGRPPRAVKRVQIALRLEPDLAERLATQAVLLGVSRHELMVSRLDGNPDSSLQKEKPP